MFDSPGVSVLQEQIQVMQVEHGKTVTLLTRQAESSESEVDKLQAMLKAMSSKHSTSTPATAPHSMSHDVTDAHHLPHHVPHHEERQAAEVSLHPPHPPR